eukprot:c23990_g10_i1 orf=250-423(+)
MKRREQLDSNKAKARKIHVESTIKLDMSKPKPNIMFKFAKRKINAHTRTNIYNIPWE